MISSSGTSYRKKWNSSSAVAELAFRLSVICNLRSALQQRKLFNSCFPAKLYIYFASSVVIPTGIAVSKGGHYLMNTTTFTKQQ